MATEKVPYVISADVNLLMQAWSKEAGFVVPPPSFFSALAEERTGFLSGAFGMPIDVVSEGELKDGINSLARSSRYPLVSMDKIYLDDAGNLEKYLEVTRAVDEDFNDLPEKVYPRQGALSVAKQLDALATDEVSPVTLVDDVLFSGGGLVYLADELAKRNRPIRQVIFGIGIGEGLDRIRQHGGIDIQCVREYPKVIDEICERDFLACIPYSGRTLICTESKYWGAPYFNPFGNPEKWASIPGEYAEKFSRLCVAQSIRLWREIESLSGTLIPTDRVPRMIKGLTPNSSIVSALKRRCV